MNSKYSYLVCGVNITFAFVGALAHSLLLLGMGVVFAIWNWYAAEYKRKTEEQENGKDNEASK